MPMTEEQIRAVATARMLADFNGHHLARVRTDALTAARRGKDIAIEMAAKYLVEAMEAQEELKDLRQTVEKLTKDLVRSDGNAAIIDLTCTTLLHENAQLKADQHAIMSKLTRLQPGGSPPPSGSPVINAYWIIDSVLNHGHYPVLKHESPTS